MSAEIEQGLLPAATKGADRAVPSMKGLGGVPRVSLLPVEVLSAAELVRHRRRLAVVVAGAAVLAVLGVVAAEGVSTTAQARLTAATQQQLILNRSVAKFADVVALRKRIALGEAAVQVASATTIDWSEQVRAIESTMPLGYAVKTTAFDGASPVGDYAQGGAVTDRPRVGSIQLGIDTAAVGDEFSIWVRGLRRLPDVADVTATISPLGSSSRIDLTVHLSPKAITAVRGAAETEQ